MAVILGSTVSCMKASCQQLLLYFKSCQQLRLSILKAVGQSPNDVTEWLTKKRCSLLNGKDNARAVASKTKSRSCRGARLL